MNLNICNVIIESYLLIYNLYIYIWLYGMYNVVIRTHLTEMCLFVSTSLEY